MSTIFEHVIATHNQSKSPDRPRTIPGLRMNSNIEFPEQGLTVTVRPIPDGSVELIAHVYGRQPPTPDRTKRVELSGNWKPDGIAVWNGAHDLAARVPRVVPNHP